MRLLVRKSQAQGKIRKVAISAMLYLAVLGSVPGIPALAGEHRGHQLGDFDYQATTNGILICAPHGTYDKQTDEIAIAVARRLESGYVVARKFTPHGTRINVNRPTEGAGMSSKNEPHTPRAQEVFEIYSDLVRKAAGKQPLKLYVEIHGNSSPLSAYQIELATTGISVDEARRVKQAFPDMMHRLRRQAPDYPRIALKMEPVDKLFFTTSGAKTSGIMADPLVPRALHFEIPHRIRKDDLINATAMLVSMIVEQTVKVAAPTAKP